MSAETALIFVPRLRDFFMVKTFFAYKDKMTARYTESGKRVSGTWLIVPNMSIVGPRNTSTLFKLQKSPKITKFKEIKTDSVIDPNTIIKLDQIIKIGDMVNVTNTTLGRGFSGGVKRWGFAGGPRTHGQSDRERAPGSSGAGTGLGRLYRGHKGPGKMGNRNVQIRNLKVLEVDLNANKLLVSGLIPGSALTLSRIEIIS